MIRPNPANLFIFCEEHPDSINDQELDVQITSTVLGGNWIDLPSNLHNGAGPFSFADGHVEIHKWVGKLVGSAGFINGGSFSQIFPSGSGADSTADLKDLNWVQARTSYPISTANQNGFPSP